MAKQTQIEQSHPGTDLPFTARFNGKLLRRRSGISPRRFKTEADAQKALNAAVIRAKSDKPLTTNQMIAMFREVLERPEVKAA